MKEYVSEFDLRFYIRLIRWQERVLLLALFRAMSRSADGQLYILAAVALYLCAGEVGQQSVAVAALAFAIEVPAFILLKNAIRRERPFENVEGSRQLVQPSDKFSMPSGHSAAAFVVATLVFAFAPTLSPIALVWACLVGTSRVVLGVHYLSDVAAGALLANNPHVKFYNAQRGYVLAKVDDKQWQTDFKIVDKVTEKGAPLRTRASYVVEAGEAGAKAV